MLSLVLNPAILCVLVWIVARSTDEVDFGKMFFIALGVGIAGALAGMVTGEPIVGIVLQIPVMGLLVFLLMKYCYLTLQQALIVAGLYFAYQIGLELLLYSMLK